MYAATEKQVKCLEGFAKDKDVSQEVLKGMTDFSKLDKRAATELIQKCFDCTKKRKSPNIEAVKQKTTGKNGLFATNYRKNDGNYDTVYLTDEELEAVRTAHAEHLTELHNELEESYPDNAELQAAMLYLRGDKVFTWIQQALDQKVREQRT